MSGNPFANIWKTEEDKQSADLTKALNKMLSSGGTYQKVDKASKEPPSRPYPPKEVENVFDKLVGDVVKTASRKMKGMGIETDIQYKHERGKWRATAKAEAVFLRKKVGGKTITIKPNDTLFKIAKAHYGDGVYYHAIAEANPKKIKLGGNFIVAHSQINLPPLEVLDKSADTDWIKRSAHGDKSKLGGYPAKEIEFPFINFDLTTAKEFKITKNTGSCAVEITVKIKGTISGKKAGPMKVKFDERGYKVEMQKMLMKHLVVKVEMQADKPIAAVSTELTGPLGNVGIKITPDMKATAVLSAKLFKRKIGDYTFEGKVGAEVGFRFLCVPSDLPPGVQERWKQHDVYKEIVLVPVAATGVVLAGGGVIVLAGGAIGTGTVAFGTATTAGALGAL